MYQPLRTVRLLFLSGIGPRVRGSRDIPGVTLDATGNVTADDIEAQCRSVFANVRAVLEDRPEDRFPFLWELPGGANLRPVAQVSIDDTWSALRYRPADKVGK